MSPFVTAGSIVESPKAPAEITWSNNHSATDIHRQVSKRKQRTQETQNEEDNRARKQAEQDLERSWMDRLQLISVITTFFASTEAQLLSTTTPDRGGSSTTVEQVANAALTGALVFHAFAAILSFTAAFVLVRFRLQEAKKEKHEDTDTEKQKIWSTNPHVAMHRIGYGQLDPPVRLLQRFNVLCIYMSVVGFCLAATGILCFVWARQTKSVSIFSSICLAGSIVAGLAVFFVSSQDSLAYLVTRLYETRDAKIKSINALLGYFTFSEQQGHPRSTMARTTKTAAKAVPTKTTDEEQLGINPTHLIKSILLLTVLASASLATQLALHPLYGSTLTSINHSKVELLACMLSALFPLDPEGLSERTTLLGLASWLGYAPYASYAIGKWITKWRNPVLGAAVAEVVVLLPTVSIGITLGRRWSSRFLSFLPGPMSLKAVGALGTFNALRVLEQWLWTHLPLGGQIYSSNVFVAIAGLLTLVAGFSPAQAPPPSNVTSGVSSRSYKRVLPLLLPVIAAIVSLSLPPNSSPRPPYNRGTATSRASSPSPPATVRVLASTHSVTGLLLVGENVEQGFRFLRADHSLLGGRWVGNKVAPGSRDGLGDSIYSAFVLQEAVRLVEREKTKDERALVIGLGVGIAAEAFITQQINTTVIEIDPVVYEYARRYFSLPEPNQLYLQDARQWVHEHVSPAAEDKYDYVVHDCFSGGGVSGHLYTLEFWEEVKGLVKSDGVVAVNFAGSLPSEPARAVFLTLQKSFGRCRAFHDHLEAEFDESYTFFNVVIFCTPLSSTPPTFRSASKADYLGSHLRRHVLGAFSRREVEPSRILGMDETSEGEEKWILQDGANRLEEWQQPDAIEHWTVMRAVLPDVFWETY